MNSTAAGSADGRSVPTPPDREHCVIGGRHIVPTGFQRRTDLLLAKIGAILSVNADDELVRVGIDGRDYAVLAVLSDDNPATQNEIASLVATAPKVIVMVVDRLERSGLVRRTRSAEDRRRSRVTLTAAGRDVLRSAEDVADRMLSEVLPGLDRAQRQKLHDLLRDGLRAPQHGATDLAVPPSL